VRQGDIWLVEMPEAKPRPALIVQRDVAIEVTDRVTVAPIFTNARPLPTWIALGADEGLDHECGASFDSLIVLPKYALTHRIGHLGLRRHEICDALNALADCG
jgi:mRNA interferase MazF